MNLPWRSLPPPVFRSALALMAVVVYAPTTVQASCGDYVHLMPESATAPNSLMSETKPANRVPVPCPCRGPQCSEAPAPLMPPAPAPAPTGPTQLEALLDRLHVDRSFGLSFVDIDSAKLSAELTTSIFHPPRW